MTKRLPHFGPPQVASFDGWTTTKGGYQVSTLDGKKYLTLFDLTEKLPGQPPDFYRSKGKYLVEFQEGPRPEHWALPQAHFLQVVGTTDAVIHKTAKAEVRPIRQRTQFTCMGASLSMCLGANGVEADEDTVNKVMGCKPMQGASWEQALAAAQHFGMRGTLIVPCAMAQLKEWTDKGVPVMIAWNPENRDWAHASVVFDVTDEGVHVADPNIPDPEETVRVVPRDEFLKKWFEKWPDYLVRRPALAIEREITKDGRQVMASLLARYAAYTDGKTMTQPLKTRPDYGSHTAADPDEDYDKWFEEERRQEQAVWEAERKALLHKVKKGNIIEVRFADVSGHRESPTAREYKVVAVHGTDIEAIDLGTGKRTTIDVLDHEVASLEDWGPEKPSRSKKKKATGAEIMLIDTNDFANALKTSADESDKDGKFEKGKPADPTKHMSPEDAKEWEEQKDEHKDKFKSATLSLADFDRALKLACGCSVDPVKDAKFEKGKSMTVEEVSKVVGPEFKEMNEDPPEAVKKLQEEMKEAKVAGSVYGFSRRRVQADVLASTESPGTTDKEAKLQARQISILKKYIDENQGRFISFFDDLPKEVQSALAKVKDQETLHSDVDRWLGDNNKTAGMPTRPSGPAKGRGRIYEGLKKGDIIYWNDHEFVIDKANDDGSEVFFSQGGKGPGQVRTNLRGDPAYQGIKSASVETPDITDRTAASGLYGFTKEAEKVCGSAANRLAKFAAKLAKEIYNKDAETPAFLEEHAKRGSKAAMMLRSAMAEIGPGAPAKTAAKRDKGRYGFPAKTVKLALDACSAVEDEAGVIASDLHGRMAAKHATITGFLSKHAKKAKCGWSDLILDAYPSPEEQVVASDKTASLEGYSIHPSVSEILAWDGTGTPREAASFLASEDEPVAGRTWDGDRSEPDDANPYNLHPDSPPAGADGSEQRWRYNRWFRENVCPDHKTNCGL